MKLLSLTLIALIVPFAAACGGGDDSSTNGSATAGDNQVIDVTATDFHFGPPALTAAAGTVTFTLTNDGQTEPRARRSRATASRRTSDDDRARWHRPT